MPIITSEKSAPEAVIELVVVTQVVRKILICKMFEAMYKKMMTRYIFINITKYNF